MLRKRYSLVWFVLAAAWKLTGVSGQGFMRGSSQARAEAQNAMSIGDAELNGLAKELYLISESRAEWELEPPLKKLDRVDGKLRNHIHNYLDGGIQLSLSRKPGKYGLRAIGRMPNGKKLRAFWRQGALDNDSPLAPPLDMNGNVDLLAANYDDAVCRRLILIEFEVVLPPVPGTKGRLPSVVYQVPMEPGRMNPKTLIPRAAGIIKVFPEGRAAEGKSEIIEKAGHGHVGMQRRAGIIDPGWAKGRAVFRFGRKLGLL